MTTWRKLITEALKYSHEDWKDIEKITLTDCELDLEFDDDYGSPEGEPFWLWTKKGVYFASEYDGSEFVSTVPRHPCTVPPSHV